MSWHFSRVQVEEYLEAISSVGKLSARLKSTPIVDQFYWPDKTTGHSNLSRYGMTSELLTDINGEELLTWFRRGFLANRSLLPGKEKERTTKEICGQKLSGSYAKWDRDSVCWRTYQVSLLTNTLDKFSGSWPRAGTIVDGIASPRLPSAPLTEETGFGLLPTPMASDAGHGHQGTWSSTQFNLHNVVLNKGKFPKWWPTPTVQDSENNGGPSQFNRNSLPLNASVGGRLNPTWVEWLMGWPLGWTDLRPLETDKFQEWYEKHGSVFRE